jgi:hypothetical protein
MSQSSAVTADQIGDWAKTVAAVGGIVGGAWALATRWLKRHRAARQRRALEGKAVRYLLDAMRHSLHVLQPGERRLVDMDELARQKVLIDGVRDELWVADGHASERENERNVAEIVRVLTRTQAIQAKGKQDMFADGGRDGK